MIPSWVLGRSRTARTITVARDIEGHDSNNLSKRGKTQGEIESGARVAKNTAQHPSAPSTHQVAAHKKTPDVSRVYANSRDTVRRSVQMSSGEDRIRTIALNAENTAISLPGGAKCGALDAATVIDADLAALIQIWQELGETEREVIRQILSKGRR